MLEFKLPKAVKRIIISQPATLEGPAAGVYELKRKRKRKKISKGGRFWEKLMRYGARANKKTIDTYIDRHNRSNRKKRDGWMRDLSNNLSRATQKGRKRFKISKLF
ncbi:hypothetical protein WME73_13215 [Sorangium sp. So ce302]|uniref:DUF6312 domain-containing protein n=1 Tax=unclassified Sorangium TaxID=2621164 RepID=UPI003F5F095B